MAIAIARNKNKRIHMMFRLHGTQYNLGTDYHCQKDGKKDCTCKSCHAARLMAKTIQQDIDRGKFEMSEFFPKHPES